MGGFWQVGPVRGWLSPGWANALSWLLTVVWDCWLGDREDIRLVKLCHLSAESLLQTSRRKESNVEPADPGSRGKWLWNWTRKLRVNGSCRTPCGLYSAPQCSHYKRCTSYSNSVCLSVCPSVRPSVTRRYCVKTMAHSTVQFGPEVEIWRTFSLSNAKINRKRPRIVEISCGIKKSNDDVRTLTGSS